jgi:TMEM175 potassium channel family protein
MAETHPNTRLEAFCDGVFAIALTLLIIDIKIPSTVKIDTTKDFWLALQHIVPSILAFILSFSIILITWVNHHAFLRLVNKSSSPFIYANGLMLLTVVFIPFPTSLLGEHILTDHPAPAVILYNAVLAIQAISWILVTGAAIKNRLAKNEKSTVFVRQNQKFGYFAFIIYFICSIVAFWIPFTIALFTTATWIFWLIWGIRVQQDK